MSANTAPRTLNAPAAFDPSAQHVKEVILKAGYSLDRVPKATVAITDMDAGNTGASDCFHH